MKYTLSVLVENRPGVLSKVSGLFSRRAFNIDSLAVGVTQNADISRITIVVDGDSHVVEQVEKQLNKLIDVIQVRILPHGGFISRELALVKVSCDAHTRAEVIQIAEIFGANILDVTPASMTLEFSDTHTRIETLMQLLAPYGVRETARTGTIALAKGDEWLAPDEEG